MKNGKTKLENRLETLDPGPGWLRSRVVSRERIERRNRWLLDNPHLSHWQYFDPGESPKEAAE